jgi:hypothetical protein
LGTNESPLTGVCLSNGEELSIQFLHSRGSEVQLKAFVMLVWGGKKHIPQQLSNNVTKVIQKVGCLWDKGEHFHIQKCPFEQRSLDIAVSQVTVEHCFRLS